MRRVALVTGASSGIGAATARALVGKGHRVIGTSRNPHGIPPSKRIPGVEYEALDLGVPESVDELTERVGHVDVLVNNAGESQSGPLEELPAEAIERLFQLNVFGQIRLTQRVLPGMRARGYGRVVMVGSMLASVPLAYRSSYVATKAAVKGFATAARFETSPFGVWLSTVEPGAISTGISERRTKYLAQDSPHSKDFHTMLTKLDHNEGRGVSADRVARTVLRVVEAERPRALYAVGSNAPLVFALQRLAPRVVLEKIVARKHGLSR